MKISLSWLKDFLDLHENAEEIGNLLTQSGLEVEGIEEYEQVKGSLQGVLIGHVVDCQPHPNADKLSITRVDIGDGEPRPVVCGAPNVAKGQKVLLATIGTTLQPASGEPFIIKKTKIRGEVSEGMICAEDELGLGDNHDGIMVLDTDLPIGTPAADYLSLTTDLIMEIGLTPNRADAASHLGVARDLKALYKKELIMPDVSAFKVDKIDRPIEVIVENSTACPRYSGLTIRGISVKDSPQWLQNRLKAIGLSPINNVVDITNYVLHELGQPLHAFDAEKIKGDKVIVKTLPQNSTFITLDEKERKLSALDLMICDAEEGMCIAGVFGGIHSGVTESTTSIFLESAYFSADYIRRTSMLHGLKTDASFRFERGTDPNMTVFALKRAALLITEIAGGQICSEIEDIYPEPIANQRIQATYKNIDRLIGKKIDRARIIEILQWLEMVIENQHEEGFTAIVPPYRVDITREADLIEEILRIYGYDNIGLSDRLSSDYLANFPEKEAYSSRLKFSEILAASGFYEIYTNSLTREGYSEKITSFSPEADVKILNKLSEELGVMRQSLVFTGLDVVAYNINRKQKDLKLFEFGRVYNKTTEGKYAEKDMLALWITGMAEPSNWINPDRKTQFHDIYTAAFKIIDKFVGDDYESLPFQDGVFQYGLELRVNGITYVRLGRLKKEVCRLAEIEQEVFYAEVDFHALLKDIRKPFEFREIPKFPEVYRDLSLVIDKRVSFEQIKDITRKKEFRLLQKVNVFDYYEGENIGDDKKAYALTFTLQDEDKTLTDKTIDKTMLQLMQSFERELGATIRK